MALAVATGVVDAGLGVRAADRDLELESLPLVVDDDDVVLPAVDAAAPLVAELHDPGVCAAVAALGGYDVERSGTVRDLSSAAPPPRSST